MIFFFFSIDFLIRDDCYWSDDSSKDVVWCSIFFDFQFLFCEFESFIGDNVEFIVEVLLLLDKIIKGGINRDLFNEKFLYFYIVLIFMVILSILDRKMLLSDIYQYVMDNFLFYNNKEKVWRNSIWYNLLLNECFVKNGWVDNGKGNFWFIYFVCVEDFVCGDFC